MINDKEQLRTFAGCFGLAGIVTSITFKMDAMSWSKFHPKKTRMEYSIPRPGVNADSLAFQKMVDLCTSSYYAQFFWFPNRGMNNGFWENCWTNDGDKDDAININGSIDLYFQVASTYIFELLMKFFQPMNLLSKEECFYAKRILQDLHTKVSSDKINQLLME